MFSFINAFQGMQIALGGRITHLNNDRPHDRSFEGWWRNTMVASRLIAPISGACCLADTCRTYRRPPCEKRFGDTVHSFSPSAMPNEHIVCEQYCLANKKRNFRDVTTISIWRQCLPVAGALHRSRDHNTISNAPNHVISCLRIISLPVPPLT